MPLSATSASVTVLTRDVIEASHAATAADLLRAAPFLQIAQSGAPGGLTTATVRGGKPNFTLVMIDGIPVNDITNLLGGSFDLSSLPVDNIEQVEIVRGPLSSLYGSDAIGGVINFISRKGSKTPLLDVSAEFGSFLRRQLRVDTAGAWKALQYSAGGTFLGTGEQVEQDAYTAGSLAFNGSLVLGQKRVLEFGARWLDDHSAGLPTASGGPEFDLRHNPVRDRAAELILGGSLKGEVRPGWSYSVDLDRVHRTEDNVTPAVLDAIPPTFRSLPASTSNTGFTRTRFGATSRFALARNLSLAVGAGVRKETGSTIGYLAATIPQSFQIARTSLLANAELQYSTASFTATAGFSFDKTEGYGEVTSPRFGMTWRPDERGPRIKGSWAKGFKLPSFYGLGNPLVGNPRLRPERARSFDAGLEQPLGQSRATISATYFRNDFRDLVDFDSATFHLVNRSQALIQGLEWGADYAASAAVRFGLDFSYLNWTLRGSAQPLRNIAHGNGGLHLAWKVSRRLHARAETQWLGRRYDYQLPVPDRTSVGGYSNTNVAADYEVSRKVSLYVRGDNLFDSGFHEYIGFPNPGIAVRAGVTVRTLAR
jgi:iron complex outermembrane receptor protein/vitamin B12 transporter